jgi:hypothetical protein
MLRSVSQPTFAKQNRLGSDIAMLGQIIRYGPEKERPRSAGSSFSLFGVGAAAAWPSFATRLEHLRDFP